MVRGVSRNAAVPLLRAINHCQSYRERFNQQRTSDFGLIKLSGALSLYDGVLSPWLAIARIM